MTNRFALNCLRNGKVVGTNNALTDTYNNVAAKVNCINKRTSDRWRLTFWVPRFLIIERSLSCSPHYYSIRPSIWFLENWFIIKKYVRRNFIRRSCRGTLLNIFNTFPVSTGTLLKSVRSCMFQWQNAFNEIGVNGNHIFFENY